MKRILYSNGSLVMGDDLAGSVVRYATALAKAHSADSVVIPIVSGDFHTLGGTTVLETGKVEMLIGPASQLVIEEVGGQTGGEDDAEFIAEIEKKLDLMQHPTPIEPCPPCENLKTFEDI